MARDKRGRAEPFSHSLSVRVLWLTIGLILTVEVLFLVPGLGRERQEWLWQKVSQAHMAAFAMKVSDDNTKEDAAAHLTLLNLSGTDEIKVMAPDKSVMTMMRKQVAAPQMIIDLPRESMVASVWRALNLVAMGGDWEIELWAPSPLQSGTEVEVVFHAAPLAMHLRAYAGQITIFSILIAFLTGLLVFIALDRLLVRPMRILTASIVGFRKDPEHAAQTDLSWLASRREDEISSAARELAVLQDEMRAALWRNARLAALGTAVAKISHDLRNILSSALLVADRLQDSPDPDAKRAARTLVPAVEHAAALVTRTVDFAREGPPAITRSPVALRELVDDAASVIQPDDLDLNIDNLVPKGLVLALDRAQIYRVLVNLLRNAVEAGASRIVVSVDIEAGLTRLMITDNGPGLPLRVQDNLFKPFTGSGRRGGTGLGLAIARDLIRAHGGDLVLGETGPRGTRFEMGLVTSDAAGA
jgi:signal transduction histidine kinase